MMFTLKQVTRYMDKTGLSQHYGSYDVWNHMDSWRRLGPNQMGKPCGRGWVGLRGACQRAKHHGGDKAATLKASKLALADKIRKKKGMGDRNTVMSDEAARSKASSNLKKVTSDLDSIDKEHGPLLFKASFTEMANRKLKDGSLSQENYDRMTSTGQIADRSDMVKAQSIRDQIASIKDSGLMVGIPKAPAPSNAVSPPRSRRAAKAREPKTSDQKYAASKLKYAKSIAAGKVPLDKYLGDRSFTDATKFALSGSPDVKDGALMSQFPRSSEGGGTIQMSKWEQRELSEYHDLSRGSLSVEDWANRSGAKS